MESSMGSMKRVGRWAVNILSAVSLLLAVMVIVAWVRGQWKADWFGWHSTDAARNTWRAGDVVVGRSGFYVSWQWFQFEKPAHAVEYAVMLKREQGFRWEVSEGQSMPFVGRTLWNRLGFGGSKSGVITDRAGSVAAPQRYWYIFDNAHVPYWFLLVVFGLGGMPVIVRLRRHRRRMRRLRNNQCVACGYDLRASSGRCPECGHSEDAAKKGTRPHPNPLPDGEGTGASGCESTGVLDRELEDGA
jgi:hypothetical protein